MSCLQIVTAAIEIPMLSAKVHLLISFLCQTALRGSGFQVGDKGGVVLGGGRSKRSLEKWTLDGHWVARLQQVQKMRGQWEDGRVAGGAGGARDRPRPEKMFEKKKKRS